MSKHIKLNIVLMFSFLSSCDSINEQVYTEVNIQGSYACHKEGFFIRPYDLDGDDIWLKMKSKGSFYFLKNSLSGSDSLLNFAQKYSVDNSLLDTGFTTVSAFYQNQNLLFPVENVDYVLEKYTVRLLGITKNIFRVYMYNHQENPNIVVIFFSNYENLQEQFDKNKSVIISFFTDEYEC